MPYSGRKLASKPSSPQHVMWCAGSVKCICCRRAVKDSEEQAGLCQDCQSQPDAGAAAMAGLLQHQAMLEQRHAAVRSKCSSCHSGGLAGSWACVNGDCQAWFQIHDASARLQAVGEALQRLDW